MGLLCPRNSLTACIEALVHRAGAAPAGALARALTDYQLDPPRFLVKAALAFDQQSRGLQSPYQCISSGGRVIPIRHEDDQWLIGFLNEVRRGLLHRPVDGP